MDTAAVGDGEEVEFSPICILGSHSIDVKLLSKGRTADGPVVDLFLLCAFRRIIDYSRIHSR